MKTLIVFLKCLVFCSFLLQDCVEAHRRKRIFSIFSVVSFPNTPCTLSTDRISEGVCFSESDCTSKGGVADGRCASGFGVCCFISIRSCGGTVTQNCTYVLNPQYPLGTLDTTNCNYNVNAVEEGICQLRLDFDNIVLNDPSTVAATLGQCMVDTFVTTSPTGYAPPVLCGTMTGQHMYIETGARDNAGSLQFNLGAGVTSRTWKVKVSQIPCGVNFKAPTDCVQYLTGTTNRFESYNYNGGAAATTIQNQEYTVCIRQEEGFCDIAYRVYMQGVANPFKLETGGNIRSKRSLTCEKGALSIPTSMGVLFTTDAYCGGFLNEMSGAEANGIVNAYVQPFIVQVVHFNTPQDKSTGFSLQYHQTACGTHTQVIDTPM